MHRCDHQVPAPALELEHFRVAKRLGDDRVTRVEVAEAHFRRLCRFRPRRKGHKGQKGHKPRYENRTSFPGSISKSRVRESAVFGLMISSMNFTKMGSSRKMAYLSIDSKSM